MAVDFGGQDVSGIAAADLSEKQFFGVKEDSGVALGDTAGEMLLGVLQNKPESGQTARYRINGTSLFKIGGTVAAGNELQIDTDGMFIAAESGDYVHGIATEAGVDGDLISARVVHYQKN